MKKIIRNILIAFVAVMVVLPAAITGVTHVIHDYEKAHEYVILPSGRIQHDDKWAKYYTWMDKDNSDGVYDKIKNCIDENIDPMEIISEVTSPVYNPGKAAQILTDTFGEDLASTVAE